MRFKLWGRPGVEILLSHPMQTNGTDGTRYKGLETGFILDGLSKHSTLVSITAGTGTGAKPQESTTETIVEEEAEEDPAPPSADQVLEDERTALEVIRSASSPTPPKDEEELELERMKYLENSQNGNTTDTVVVVSK